jgi:SAM-dependent methyltransferase
VIPWRLVIEVNSTASTYHFDELAIVNDPGDPRRTVPSCAGTGWCVLDVGCGTGQTLTAAEFRECSELHGIDVDVDAIAFRRRHHPHPFLSVAGAERIPYPADTFYLSYSRVSLPTRTSPSPACSTTATYPSRRENRAEGSATHG